MSLKGFRIWLQNLSFESLFRRIFFTILGFSSIFGQLLLFDHKQLCIGPLELSNIMSPGITVNQQKKPLRNSLNVSRAKYDVLDFWACSKINHKEIFNLLRSIDRHKQEVIWREISRKEIISVAASLSLDSQKSRVLLKHLKLVYSIPASLPRSVSKFLFDSISQLTFSTGIFTLLILSSWHCQYSKVQV